MKKLAILGLLPLMLHAANYSVESIRIDDVPVVRLTDRAHSVEVAVAPSLGNLAYEMKVKGKNIFWVPFQSIGQFKSKPTLCGNPFLAPWANRLDEDAFYANGKKYSLNASLGNFRRDGNKNPIHGLLAYSDAWQVVETKATDTDAAVTSRLEFYKYPDLMAQFPFAHILEMSYRLKDGVLEVETRIENLSNSPMPVAIGYHPYFRLHDSPRDQWKVHLAAREHVVLSDKLIPTGERKPVSLPDPVSLATTQLDDVFTGLVAGPDGRAEFSVTGVKEKIAVHYGPKYIVAVVYSPPGRDFICFEPMAGVTNATNLAHAGKYRELQTIPPGGVWKESFWVVPSGF